MHHPLTRAGITLLFRAVGAILLIVSAIHFAVTQSLLRGVVDSVGAHVDAASSRLLHASFLLNHLVVGVLVVPVGLSTIFAATGIARGDPLARRVGWANTLAVLALPLVIVFVMGSREIFSGGPFTIAVTLVLIAALCLVVGMCVSRPNRFDSNP